MKTNPYQIYLIKIGLVKYEYILKNWRTKSKDFEKVYQSFYLQNKLRSWGKNSKSIKREYFRMLYSQPESIKCALKSFKTTSKKWDLSIISKLMHTINPDKWPIFDKGVMQYLNKNYNLHIKDGWDSLEDVWQTYGKVYNWYKNKKFNVERHNIIKWFDKTFNSYKWISDVKKVDFYIYTSGLQK